MALYAYREYPRRAQARNIYSKVAVTDEPPTYYEESWSQARTMGKAKSHAYQTTREGPGYNSRAYDDVRVVSEADAQRIKDIDEYIAELRQERQVILEDQFLAWPQATRDDCQDYHAGTPQQEVVQQLKGVKVAPASTVASEQKMVRDLNAVFRGL